MPGTPLQKLKIGESDIDYPLNEFRLLENIMIPVDWAMALLLVKAMKTERGAQLIEKFGEKWLDSEARIIQALAQSGAGNIITAYSHGHLIAMMLEHSYMIRKGGAGNWIGSMNWLTGATVIAEIFGSIAVPSVLAFSSGGEVLPKHLSLAAPAK